MGSRRPRLGDRARSKILSSEVFVLGVGDQVLCLLLSAISQLQRCRGILCREVKLPWRVCRGRALVPCDL